ncbi:hypothetical protein ABIB40_001179 [Pedobacter sp. UYP30]
MLIIFLNTINRSTTLSKNDRDKQIGAIREPPICKIFKAAPKIVKTSQAILNPFTIGDFIFYK